MDDKYIRCSGETIKNKTQAQWDEEERYWLKGMEEKQMKRYIDHIAGQLPMSDKLLCRLSIKYAVKPLMGPELDPDFSCEVFAKGE